MPSKKLTPEQAKKQKEALARYHANKNKNTSANIPRVAKSSVGKKISTLSGPSIDLIGKAILGELVPEKSVWKGTEEEKVKILQKDPTAKFEMLEIEDGIEIEVLIEWVKVPESKIALAKWILSQDMALTKAAEESKLRRLEAALKEKRALDEGAVVEDDGQEKAREFGGPRKLDISDSEFEDD
jgi:hypothetical protein